MQTQVGHTTPPLSESDEGHDPSVEVVLSCLDTNNASEFYNNLALNKPAQCLGGYQTRHGSNVAKWGEYAGRGNDGDLTTGVSVSNFHWYINSQLYRLNSETKSLLIIIGPPTLDVLGGM